MNSIANARGEALLLEREGELEVLRSALERLTEGDGSTVLIEGPAGIGKTRLLAEAADLAAEAPVLVRTARAGLLEREMPFGVARQLLAPLIERAGEEERSRLLAGSAGLSSVALGRTGPGDGAQIDQFTAIDGLYWLLANLAEIEPVVLIVDDVQWADGQSLRWLDFVARRAADTGVLIVASARTGEPDEPSELESLRADTNSVIHPSPLSHEAVVELIGGALDSEPPEVFAEACASASGGNPFLLNELLRGLLRGGTDPTSVGPEEIEGLASDTVASSIRARLQPFGADAVELARAVAVLGGAPQLRHVGALAGIDEDRARELCDRLRDAEILELGRSIEFVHPLVRAAVYGDLSVEARSHAHRCAAEVLSSTGSDVRDVAPHLLVSKPNGDQWVVEQLRGAAHEVARAGSPYAARRYLERALAEPAEAEAEVTFEFGRALWAEGDPGAPEVLEGVVETATDPELRLRATKAAAWAAWDCGDLDGAARGLESLVDSIPVNGAELRLRTEAFLFCARIVRRGRRSEDTTEIEEIVARTGVRTPGERMVRQALSFERLMACEPVDQVVGLASCSPPPPWVGREPVPALACHVMAWCGEWAAARDVSFRGWRSATGLVGIASYRESALAEIDRLAGELVSSEAEARTAWEIVRDHAPSSLPGLFAISKLVRILVARGQLDEARKLADQWDLSAPFSAVPVFPVMLETRGTLRLASGEFEEGVEDLGAAGEDLEQLGYLNPAAFTWRQDIVPALCVLDRTAEAQLIVSVGEDRAREFGAPHVIGAMLRARASTESRSKAIETLGESVALLGAHGSPTELAESALALGSALRRGGHRSESRDPLRQALELAHTCGAGALVERAREELAAAGSRPRSVLRTGIDSLTASELRTARMAAEGLSNVEIAQRLFVTRKTVEKHLSNAYAKLEISSRKELPEALSRS